MVVCEKATEETLWKPIEASPEVLKHYWNKLGGPENVQFFEIFSTEHTKSSRVYHQQRLANCLQFVVEKDPACAALYQRLWFTSQKVPNSCGTVALLHVIANLCQGHLTKNGILESYYSRTAHMTPQQRGEDLSQCHDMRTAHQETQQLGDSSIPDAANLNVSEHFVALVDLQDYIAEFDGRLEGPILTPKKLFHSDDSDTCHHFFLHDALTIVQEHYIKKNAFSLKFSMTAVCV